ncbi:MAG: hypothetical protein MZV65_39680 [Chromatiales bacterium]|nr:hypothetical protein [Chromatiales bacterium]MCK7581157.1 hypothetical protein [Chromatiales bacterium]
MDNARQFAAKAGVQVDWLLTGRGPKLPATIEATATIQVQADELPLTASGRIEVKPEPSLSDLLDALSARLEQADPAVRQEVAQLVMRYMENPEAGARIAAAIELLLGKPTDDSAV